MPNRYIKGVVAGQNESANASIITEYIRPKFIRE